MILAPSPDTGAPPSVLWILESSCSQTPSAMQHLRHLPKLSTLAAVAALAWSAIPSADDHASSGLSQQTAAQSSFLALAGSNPIASSLDTGSTALVLPSSVMPNNQQKCSAQSSDPGNLPKCSAAVVGGVIQRCSAHVDSRQQCSAFLEATGTQAACSTLGRDKPSCSVLQPAMGSIAPSTCSAFGTAAGKATYCSVIGDGGKQFCSVENPASQAQNQCSTFPSGGGSGGTHMCSALMGGGAHKNFCSARNAAPPGSMTGFCSAHAPGSACSIRIGQKGQCTSLQNAPQGSCSAFAANSHCSVIGGLPGNTVCP